MSALAWIALAILGVHLVAAFIVVYYLNRAVNALEDAALQVVAQGSDIRDSVKDSSNKVNAVTTRFKTAAHVLLDE